MASPRWSVRRQLTIANAATTAGLLTGLTALVEATRTGWGGSAPRLRLVVALIVLAAILYAVDGPPAPARHTARPVCAHLASLADTVSFGVVPPVALHFAQLHSVPVAGAAASAGFCICAAWRLARFPLCQRRHSFVGCPVPLAAVIAGLPAVAGSEPVGTLVAVTVLSALM